MNWWQYFGSIAINDQVDTMISTEEQGKFGLHCLMLGPERTALECQ